MKRAVVVILATLGITAIGLLPTQAVAHVHRCPPLPVAMGDLCECSIFNYSNTQPTVRMILYISGQEPESLPASEQRLPKFDSKSLLVPAMNDAHCGCEVRGGGNSSRVSLSVVPVGGMSAQAAVRCGTTNR